MNLMVKRWWQHLVTPAEERTRTSKAQRTYFRATGMGPSCASRATRGLTKLDAGS